MYIITVITERILDANGLKWEFVKQDYCEKFDKFGNMHLWCLAWFKTTGANRTIYRGYKNRKVYPQEHAIAEMSNCLNWYKTEDFSLYTGEKFREFLTGDSNSEYGVAMGYVYQKNGIVKSIYARWEE